MLQVLLYGLTFFTVLYFYGTIKDKPRIQGIGGIGFLSWALVIGFFIEPVVSIVLLVLCIGAFIKVIMDR